MPPKNSQRRRVCAQRAMLRTLGCSIRPPFCAHFAFCSVAPHAHVLLIHHVEQRSWRCPKRIYKGGDSVHNHSFCAHSGVRWLPFSILTGKFSSVLHISYFFLLFLLYLSFSKNLFTESQLYQFPNACIVSVKRHKESKVGGRPPPYQRILIARLFGDVGLLRQFPFMFVARFK